MYRGRVRNFDLRVPLLNTGSVLVQFSLNRSRNFAGSAEPMEPVLTRPLVGKVKHLCILDMIFLLVAKILACDIFLLF